MKECMPKAECVICHLKVQPFREEVEKDGQCGEWVSEWDLLAAYHL